jgi:hypothetical protein
MIVLRVRNVNEALREGVALLREHGIVEDSRNGPVVRAPEPVCTVYERPRERVLFHAGRDANPFFHFYESLWMLAGREDVAPLARYVGRMREYSDDGLTLAAAYGARWRHAPGGAYGTMDQLGLITDHLRADPTCRRQVLQIWSSADDLVRQNHKKDVACNLVVTFQRKPRTDKLDAVILCRSNDMIWGAYGANAVHFSVLHEYVATFSGMQVGTMTQISVNLHAYTIVFDELGDTLDDNRYASPAGVEPFPIAHTSATRAELPTDRQWWDRQVSMFVTRDGRLPLVHEAEFVDPFFRNVAAPIVLAHDIYKGDVFGESNKKARIGDALSALSDCAADDWRIACSEWLKRRRDR